MLIRQWVMVLPLSKSTFLSSELIPSHIPSFQLWFSRLALHSNVRFTFPYVKKCKPRNCSCNSFITHLCTWDCNQQHHGKHSLLEIPQDSQSPRIKVLCRRSLTADVQLERSAHSNLIQIHEYTNCVCLSWKAGNSLSMYAGAGNRDKPRAAQHSFHLHQWFFLSCTHKCIYPSPSLFFLDSRNLNIQPCGSGPWPCSLI